MYAASSSALRSATIGTPDHDPSETPRRDRPAEPSLLGVTMAMLRRQRTHDCRLAVGDDERLAVAEAKVRQPGGRQALDDLLGRVG